MFIMIQGGIQWLFSYFVDLNDLCFFQIDN